MLTIDKNGKSADEAGFDPTQITQYGFEPQRDDIRDVGNYFGSGTLAAADGSRVGSLCLIDSRPRQLDERQLNLLRDLADLVQAELAAGAD